MIDTGLVFDGIQIAISDSGLRARWQVPSTLPYFGGHFPDAPIFPAVGILDATLHALRLYLKSPSLQLTEISQAKFLSPISPGHQVALHCRSIGPNAWECEWKDEKLDKVLSLLHLTTAESDASAWARQ